MCGRYAFTLPKEAMRQLFDLDGADLAPRFNIAPGQDVVAVGIGKAGLSAFSARWGLVPHWAKDASIGNKMINARSETLAEKPAFRDALQKQRCAIPADLFYEWCAEGKGPKQPYAIARPDRAPFAFAGLYSLWKGGDAPLLSVTIITADAAPEIAPLHHRMPIMLTHKDQIARWVDRNAEAGAALKTLDPYSGPFETWPISTTVNKGASDDESLLAPLGQEVQGSRLI